MSTYYLDTCSLKWRYLLGKLTTDVNSIVDVPANNVYTGELTILEWSSALAWAVRERTIDYNAFKSNELALFRDIAEERLKIFQPRRVIERARSWIEFVAVIKQHSLRSGDAIHIATVVELSSKLGETVEFVTSDWRFFRIVDSLNEFRPHLNAHYFDPAP